MSREDLDRRSLTIALDRVRGLLEAQVARLEGGEATRAAVPASVPREDDPAMQPRLQVVGDAFGLSPFERDVLVLCAGVELDASLASLCARASGDRSQAFPTFGLALAALPEPHWDALSPSGPLRRWDLVELDPGPVLTQARLRVPGRLWQLFLGVDAQEERLSRYTSPAEPTEASPSQAALARRAGAAWGPAVVVQLSGRSRPSLAAVAVGCAEHLGLAPLWIAAEALPSAPDELERLVRLLRREALLAPLALLIDAYDLGPGDAARAAVQRLVATYAGHVLVTGRQRMALGARSVMSFDVDPPTPGEQRARWAEAITGLSGVGAGAAFIAPLADALACQFDLDFSAMRTATARAVAAVSVSGAAGGAGAEGWRHALWEACRAEARPQLEDLAQRIEARVGWDDLVLPDNQRRVLRDVEIFVARRAIVDGWWGADTRTARGLGTSVLFSGPSGTGKTLAAEVLASRLRLDLYRIDLSAVVSKYIGETEKNLRRVFDAAEHGGALLLFDEADALFAKRSEVKDSHDRYANVEVGYLLQRIEAFRGLSILTTNMKSTIDQAFLRRIRFIVDFAFPDEAQRAAIWARAFPPGVPLVDLDFAVLARLNVSGASIRSMALHAAHLAADEAAAGKPPAVRMHHLQAAARREYEKLQQPLTALETKGWR